MPKGVYERTRYNSLRKDNPEVHVAAANVDPLVVALRAEIQDLKAQLTDANLDKHFLEERITVLKETIVDIAKAE